MYLPTYLQQEVSFNRCHSLQILFWPKLGFMLDKWTFMTYASGQKLISAWFKKDFSPGANISWLARRIMGLFLFSFPAFSWCISTSHCQKQNFSLEIKYFHIMWQLLGSCTTETWRKNEWIIEYKGCRIQINKKFMNGGNTGSKQY